MKKFCVFCILFLVPLAICYICYSLYLYKSKEYEKTAIGWEIYSSIRKSKEKTFKRKLIIGDSTAFQFFNEQNDNDIFSLACNQAISLCGHYILLNNYLSVGNRPEEVYLIYMPFSFCNNLDDKYAYGYFLKPFYKDEYIPFMTETVKEQINKIPFNEICQCPIVLTSSWTPSYKSEPKNYSFLSPISIEYLNKLDSLSIKYHFMLYVVPSIISKNQNYKIDKNEFNKEKFADKFDIYLNNISVVDNSLFRDDVHLKQPSLYLSEMKEKMDCIKSAYSDAGIR